MEHLETRRAVPPSRSTTAECPLPRLVSTQQIVGVPKTLETAFRSTLFATVRDHLRSL